MTIGTRIKAAREAAHLTQEELGNKVGVTGVTIMRYEKNQREPRYDMLEKIADALDVWLTDLLPKDESFILDMGYMKGLKQQKEWLQSDGYAFSAEEQALVVAFNKLNPAGREEAVKRVTELTELPKYTD